MSLFASYIPFVEPMNALHDYWYVLLVPLAFGISVVYKAMRLPRLDVYWRQVALMTSQVVIAMVGLAIALALFIQLVIPLLPAE